MAKGDSTELYMKFVGFDNRPVKGESTAVIIGVGGVANPLSLGFRPREMFEVDSFTLSAGSSLTSSPFAKQFMQQGGDPKAIEELMARLGPPPDESSMSPLQPVTFNRPIDASSPELLQNLIKGTGYQSASLIKRKAAGRVGSGDVFLRVDFTNVLLTNIGWDEGDEVVEKTTFICNKVSLRYRKQEFDGSLGPVIQGLWEYKKT